MPFTNARNRNDGFTLIEMLIVLIMLGILSASTAPSVLGLYARFQVKSALNQVQGAFQEGQRQAMRTSKTCSLSLDNFNSLIAGTCLLTGTRQLSGVSMRSSLTALQFNLKGLMLDASSASLTQPVTVVISSNKTSTQSCLVLSTPLGLMRTGTYAGTDTVDSHCLP